MKITAARMKVFGEEKRKPLGNAIPEVVVQSIETLRGLRAFRLSNRLEEWALENFKEDNSGNNK